MKTKIDLTIRKCGFVLKKTFISVLKFKGKKSVEDPGRDIFQLYTDIRLKVSNAARAACRKLQNISQLLFLGDSMTLKQIVAALLAAFDGSSKQNFRFLGPRKILRVFVLHEIEMGPPGDFKLSGMV